MGLHHGRESGNVGRATMKVQAMSRLELTDSRLSQLYELWKEKRGERVVPCRADFTPEVLKPWLGNLILIEVCEDGQYRYRLYGSAFVDRFGVEMTKRSVEDLPRDQATAIRRDYDAVVRSKTPTSRVYTDVFDIIDINRRLESQRIETWERLVLPLSVAVNDQVSMLMVAAYERIT